ncbi:MAG: hypothetical protein B7Y25_01000 [Alphaproteobacteria bacterium 16-39-46]|nr:MAG: hypothetical protein B7Y25_01000 [Alphaproteobacteria bacterium 16-39-46]OZA44202.1 MAG: hypothetical protein B7X84_01080 [Alphaproteobacteria bacterium 17-39-52]HQS83670.1 hypothetical protein [Alphaproteobacteria bacterium]HQS93414.1 hypothetical protein [Alphaproteobacteria bacterium]
MIQILKKSASVFLLSGALLFVPHMGECVTLPDGVYVSDSGKTRFEIKGKTIKGHFSKAGNQVLLDGYMESDGHAEFSHDCNGPCSGRVADKSKTEFSTTNDGKIVGTSTWIDPKTKQVHKKSEILTQTQTQFLW